MVLDLTGKHGRVRTVPRPGWCKTVGLNSGRIFLPTAPRSDHLPGQGRLSLEAVTLIVRKYGCQIGLADLAPEELRLAPHDLRQTPAKLAHTGGAPTDQILLSLGHASIQTTEGELGVDQNLESAPCDVLGRSLKSS